MTCSTKLLLIDNLKLSRPWIVQAAHLILGTLGQDAGLCPLGQEHQLAALPPQDDRHALSDLCKVHQSNTKNDEENRGCAKNPKNNTLR